MYFAKDARGLLSQSLRGCALQRALRIIDYSGEREGMFCKGYLGTCQVMRSSEFLRHGFADLFFKGQALHAIQIRSRAASDPQWCKRKAAVSPLGMGAS